MSADADPGRRGLIQDPIERKVLFLVFMLVLMASTFIVTDTIRQTAIQAIRHDLENQSARSSLGKIILKQLLHIDKDIIMLAAAEDERDVDVTHSHIQIATTEIKKALTVLQNGGTYANVLPMNFGALDEVVESVSFQTDQASRYVIEVIDLTPKIIDIEQYAADLQAAVHDKLRTQPAPVALTEKVEVLRKRIQATTTRSRETANKINYDTSLRINTLETEIPAVSRTFEMVRNIASACVFLLGMVVCLRTLGQIRSIVNERTNYAHQLRQANTTISRIVEALPVGIAVIKPDTSLIQINQHALKMLEADSADQVLGRSCRDLFCSAATSDCPIATGKIQSISRETELITRSGNRVPVIKQAIKLHLDNEDVILEAFIDISERVKIEKDLTEKQNYINAILEAATVGIVVVDAKDHHIVEANPAALAIIGASRSSVIGSPCREWMCAADNNRCPITDQKKTIHQAECVIQNAAGKDVPIVKNVSTTLLHGRQHIVESFVNIAPLKAAEARVRRLNEELERRVIERTTQLQTRNDELKTALEKLKTTQDMLLQSEKMASIGQLAAGVAHEINNPIGFVKSNLSAINDYLTDLMDLVGSYEAMQKRAEENAAIHQALADEIKSVAAVRDEIDMDFIREDFVSVLHETTEGVDRMANIVADLKNFAHKDDGALEWAGVNEVIESSLNIVWNELKYKAEVVRDLAPLPDILCYPQRLSQVFMNLLVNAGQALEDNGTIRITSRADGEHVKVSISDTGCGIPDECLNKIYDPFFTTKEVGQGTGLGLNVVYNIVQSHQGTVRVESTPGQGTTFTIRLPIEMHTDGPVPPSNLPN